MEEKCKYCLYIKECSNKIEYGSIMCACHREIPKDIENSYIEMQQENAQLKEQISFHEKYNKEASDQIIKDEEVIKQLKEQLQQEQNNNDSNNHIVIPELESQVKELKSKLELKRGSILARQNIKFCEENAKLKEECEARADIVTTIKLIYEILDKHNNQPDYKSAFIELTDYLSINYEQITLDDLKEKYNLGGE